MENNPKKSTQNEEKICTKKKVLSQPHPES